MIIKDEKHILTLFLLFSFSIPWVYAETTTQWSIQEIQLTARDDYPWWEFPAQAVFVHESGRQITVKAFWNGKRNWIVRYTPTLPGQWTFRILSDDPGMKHVAGRFTAIAPTKRQTESQPNYRGHIRISKNKRFFEYANGTPLLLMADTVWAINTARCGLGENQDGPFYQYLVDRKAKGFNTILMSYMRGFGDTPNEIAGHRNEGGYPFVEGEISRMNPAYFHFLDVRMQALWNHGFVCAVHPTWFGKRGQCFFDLTWAKRISAYLAVRYGAFNAIWSLSGEYQGGMRDCNWSTGDMNELGETVQTHNPYSHPLSVHPGSGYYPGDPHRQQSSAGAFHQQKWLDHNWLQLGQSSKRIFQIPIRCQNDYDRTPVKPVFCSEAYYEQSAEMEPDHAYYSRWQLWTALLNGAIGYGYGADGIWQFYDPNDPNNETGFSRKNKASLWQNAIHLEGSRQIRHLDDCFSKFAWWNLAPCRDWLFLESGTQNPMPNTNDISPPHCAKIPGELYIMYIPKGNEKTRISICDFELESFQARWFNPRNGNEQIITETSAVDRILQIPVRPQPAHEDWVFIAQSTYPQ